MKKTVSLILSIVMIISVMSCATFVSAAETKILTVDNCDSADNWQATNGGLDTLNFRQGCGSITARGIGSAAIANKDPLNVTVENGIRNMRYIEMWVYINNVELLGADTNITISMDDANDVVWHLDKLNLVSGWNKLDLSIVLASKKFTTLNFVNFNAVSDSYEQMVIKLDDICLSNANSVSDEERDSAHEAIKEIENAGVAEYSGIVGKRIENTLATYKSMQTLHDSQSVIADVESVKVLMNQEDEKSQPMREKNIYTDTILTHGRTYYKNNELYFNWSASGYTVRFYGTELKVKMRSNGTSAYVNTYVDKEINMVEYDTDTHNYSDALNRYNEACPPTQLSTTETEYTLVSGLPEGVHTVTVLKRGEVIYTANAILTEIIESENCKLLAPPLRSTRTIEFIGDSNTTGYGNLLVTGGGYDAKTQDGTVQYSAYAANALYADYTLTAKSGICLCPTPGAINSEGSMHATYEYTDYWNYGGDDADKELYDFAKNTPDVIVINLGENDEGRAGVTPDQFKEYTKEFIRKVRDYNPDSLILLAYSIEGLNTYVPYERAAVDEINDEGDPNVYFYQFITANMGGPAGHPTMTAHKSGGRELAEEISRLTGWTTPVHEVYADPMIENGTFEISTSYAEEGETVTVTPVPAEGYIYEENSIAGSSGGATIQFEENERGGFTFTAPATPSVITGKFVPKPLKKYYYGDINNDTKVDSTDALIALQYKVQKATLDEIQLKSANVSGDTEVDSTDALLILQYKVNKISEFPAGEFFEQ